MDHAVVWAVVGLVLVIVELLTGTFYLLVLGIAAFGAALAAWLGLQFSVQSIIAALIGPIGCYGVHLYRARNRAEQMAPIDAGMPASFKAGLDAGARLARVRYRGASWDTRGRGAMRSSRAPPSVLAADGKTLA